MQDSILHAVLERACRQASVGWYRRFSNAFQLATYRRQRGIVPRPPSLTLTAAG